MRDVRVSTALMLTVLIVGLVATGGCRRATGPVVVATSGDGRLERWGKTDVVFLVGDPYERGHQQGSLLKEQVRVVAAGMAANLANKAGVDVRAAELAKELAPDELAEMQGIADGAEIDFSGVLKINVMYELVLLQGCSQFAAEDAGGTLIVGRNLDFDMVDVLSQASVVQVVLPDSGQPYLAPSFSGMAGVVTGINRSGVYAAANAIPRAEQSSDGVAVSFAIQRLLLGSTSMAEASSFLTNLRPAAGYKLMLASASERRFSSPEVGVTRTMFVMPRDGYIVATNHYVSSEMLAVVPSQDDNRQGQLTGALMVKPLFDANKGIELLGKVAAGRGLSSQTIQSMIWLPDRDELWYSDNALPATDGDFECLKPVALLDSMSPVASQQFAFTAKVQVIKEPANGSPGSHVRWDVRVAPRLPLRNVQVTLRLSDAVQRLQPGYTMARTITSQPADLDPSGKAGSAAHILGINSGVSRITALSGKDYAAMRAALVEPMMLDLTWDGGKASIRIPTANISYEEYASAFPPR